MNTDNFIKELNKELSCVQDYTKEDVFASFEKYVRNKTALRNCVDFGLFFFDYVHYKGVIEGTVFEDALIEILDTFEKAFTANQEGCKRVYQNSYSEICKGLAGHTQMMWTKSEEKPNRFDVLARELFRDMGQMIEEELQPYISFVQNLQRIAEGKQPEHFRLGVNVNTLIGKSNCFKIIYKEILQDIPVSQWRNIAYHTNFKVKNEVAEVWYGSNQVIHREIAKEDLIMTIETIDTILYLNKTAFTLIGIDYGQYFDISTEIGEKSNDTRNDDILIQITESAFAHGYRILSYDSAKRIIILDTMNDTPTDNLIRFMQIVAVLIDADFTARVMTNNVVICDVIYAQSKLSIIHYSTSK